MLQSQETDTDFNRAALVPHVTESKDKKGGGSAELLPWTCRGQTLGCVGDGFTESLGRQY